MNTHQGIRICSNGSFDVMECDTCGFKHVYPLPSEEELELIYRNEYYTSTKPDYIKTHQRDAAWWMQTYSARLEKMKAIIATGKNRFLDVGSGPGLMLQAAKEAGFNAIGIEPNIVASTYARSQGCEVIQDFLTSELATKLGSFDAIHSSEVLEHIRDPRSMVSLMASMLKPGGVICIFVPNDFNPLQKALIASGAQKEWWVAPPHHLNYFSHSSLKQLVQSCGLEIMSLTSSFPIELFLAMGDNYIGNDELGASCHNKRKVMETLLVQAGYSDLLDGLYQKFAELEIGREIILIARKPV